MLLNEDAVFGLLCHADEFVRGQAFDYFAESLTTRQDILPVLLNSIREQEWKYKSPRVFLWQLPVSGVALDGMIELLAGTEDENHRFHLGKGIARARAEDLDARWDGLKRSGNLHKELLARCHRKRKAIGTPPMQLWESLVDYCIERYGEHIEDSLIDDTLQALSGSGIPDSHDLFEFLFDEDHSGDWLEIVAIRFFGHRREIEAIPILFGRLRQPFDDYLHPETERALIRIGAPAVTDALALDWMAEPYDFRRSIAFALGCMPSPQAEDAIIRALATETDAAIRTYLSSGLCRIYSDRAIEFGLREVERGYDDELLSLEEDIVTVADSLGKDFPQKARWKSERTVREERLLYRKSELTGYYPYSNSSEGLDLELPPFPSLPSHIEMPVKQKVGRNAPCPCGSGKKYKKCCGRG